MIYTKLTRQAMKLCFEAHKDQVDKTEIPYVFHPFHLAEQMNDEYTTVIALLHDVVEDTEYSFKDLEDMGYPKEVIDALRLLTHEKGVPYMEYISKIKDNPLAKTVKLADLRHNSDITRLNVVDEKTIRRCEKYKKAILLLEEA